jgi:zinc transporter, ZIP family
MSAACDALLTVAVAQTSGNALSAAGWGALGAAALLIGAALALTLPLRPRETGLIMGFGAGALIAAVAYELVPEAEIGLPALQTTLVVLALVAGALVFFAGDVFIDRRGGKGRKKLAHPGADGGGRAIFLGTLLDGVPESVILGMSLATGGKVSLVFLAAVFISNLPEGVAGTVSLRREGVERRTVLIMWFALVVVSAACAALGWTIADRLPGLDGVYVQAFAAGAVLTMLADTMMPEAYEQGGKAAGLLTVLGFVTAAVLAVVG